MRIRLFAAAAALSIAFAGASTANAAAFPIDRAAPGAVPGLVQEAQFVFGGRNYCWYDRGWNGPGFYWCGYAFRRGFGWGGGHGWHGWDRHRHFGGQHRPRPHGHRPHSGRQQHMGGPRAGSAPRQAAPRAGQGGQRSGGRGPAAAPSGARSFGGSR